MLGEQDILEACFLDVTYYLIFIQSKNLQTE